jgi:hypothetical protein
VEGLIEVRGWKGAAIDLSLRRTLGKYPSIATSVDFSAKALNDIRSILASSLGEPTSSSPTIAISGSLARLEGSACSDLDYMIIYPGSPSSDAATLRESVATALKSVPTGSGGAFAQPNPKGVFKDDIDGSKLVNEIGDRAEDYKDVSRRLLLLLESQALWNERSFDTLREDIANVYAKSVNDDPSKHFVLLLNDLIRYFRTICVHYHSEMNSEYGKWPIRNIKLRHSRVLMYTSLLVVLGELSKFEYSVAGSDKVGALKEFVGCPPLERFARVYAQNYDDNLFRLLGPYNFFLERLSDASCREELENLEYEDRYSRSAFASLKSNSDAFAAEVARLINARRGQWSDRFFEYLLV